jgi:hypothetical protein
MYTLQQVSGDEIITNREMYGPHLPTLVDVLNLSRVKRKPELLFSLLEEPKFRNLKFSMLTYEGKMIGFTKYTNYPCETATTWAKILTDHGFITRDFRTWVADAPTPLSNEVEIFKNEVFKVNRHIIVDFLSRKWAEFTSLLRMVCVNRAYFPEKSYSYNMFLDKNVNLQQLITKPNTTIPTVMQLRAHLRALVNEKAVAEDILTAYSAVKSLPEQPEHHNALKEALLDIFETYELHTRPTSSIDSENGRIFAVQIQPLDWRRTAIHDTLKKWDIWNYATYIISRAEESGVDIDVIRAANVKVSTILSVKRPIVIARKKEMPQPPLTTESTRV